MRQEKEKVTENGANNQTGGGSVSPASKRKENTILYIIAGVVLAVFTYLILK